MSKNYFIGPWSMPAEGECIIVGLDNRLVPMMLRLLKMIDAPVYWETQDDYAIARPLIAAAQESILMECGTAIVNNIIALRGIDPAAPRDELTGVPLAPPAGSTLVELFATLQGPTAAPGALLERIAVASEATAQTTADGLLSEDGVLLQLLLAAI